MHISDIDATATNAEAAAATDTVAENLVLLVSI